MKIKSMYTFEGLTSFNKFSDFLDYEHWRIEKQLLKERVETYKKNKHFEMFLQQFNNQNLSIWELKHEEIITWFDTLLLMRRLVIELFKKGIDAEKMHIIMEYPLVYGNHMRSDYIIIYDRLIIVLEFGMFNQDEKRSEERYTKKLQESINYRQIIGNLVSSHIQVVNYVMIYLPEYNRYTRNESKENIEHNKGEIALLSKFMIHNINQQDSLSALKQLELIEAST